MRSGKEAGRPGRFSSRDARHERHLYALRSDGAANDVTLLASVAHTLNVHLSNKLRVTRSVSLRNSDLRMRV